MKKLNRQGGFSKNVATHNIFKDYAASPFCAGYIGSSSRTIERDKLLEKILREQGLGDGGIACWLTSGHGRHLMDDVNRRTTPVEFSARAHDFTKNAFINVTIWSHPDHTGFLDSSRKLHTLLQERVS